jgi:hypothetical protein
MDLPDKTSSPKPEKNIKQVVTGAKQVQRPATKRFFDFLFAESPKALVKKIGREVMVPRVKAGFEEAANSFLSGMLWGDSSNRPISNVVRGTVLRGGIVNYHQASGPNSMAMAHQATVIQSSGNYQDLVVPTQQAAEFLLTNMYDLLNEYRIVAVGDLYDLAGITSAPSDNAYGWHTLDGARISKARDGYLLELPRPTLI